MINSLGENDLPAPESIAFVSKSTDGFYYLGNTTGLSVFDGKVAEQLTIRDHKSPYVHDQTVQSKMYEDGNELLWFSTYTALHAYDPSRKSFQTYRIVRDGNMVQQNYHVFHLDRRSGELWLKAGNQIWSFDTQTMLYRRIAGPTLGNRFLVTSKDGKRNQILACPFSYGKGLEVFTPRPGAIVKPRLINIDENVISAIDIGDSTFLLGLNTGLAELKLSDTTFQFSRITRSDKNHSVWDFCHTTGSGLIWMSFTGYGLHAYDPQQRVFVDSINIGDGISSNDPKELYADGPSRILVSQYNTGIDIIETTPALIKTNSLLSGKGISSVIVSEEKSLLAAGLLALYKSRSASLSGKWEPLKLPESSSRPPYRGKFYEAKGQLFLQGLRKIWSYDRDKSRWRSYPKQEYPVRGMFLSPSTSFLMLSERGVEICKIQDEKILTEPSLQFSPTGTNDFLGLFQLTDSTFLLPWRSSEVWIGAYNEQGYHLRQRIPLPGEIQATLNNSKEGNVYVGGTSGLYLIQNEQAKKIHLTKANDKNPIVEALVKDRDGLLWIGTRNGLFSYNEADSSSIWYSAADGLPANRFNDSPALLLPSDSILMGTRNGLFTFAPRQLVPDTLKLSPYISGLRINDLDVFQDSTFQFVNNRLPLPHRKNKLDFQVANIGLHQGGISSIEYQLIGFEEFPTTIDAHQTIRYPNLPPGNYTLQLTAINRNGLPSGKKSLDITINPPFTQTLLFYALCTCALALIAASLYILGLRRERLKQQRLQEQRARLAAERDRIAGEVHDDLGGQISSILYLSEEMLLTGETPEYEYELNRINELSRNSLQNVRDIIFALDNRRATLSALGDQLRGAGETFFGDRKISFRLTDEYQQPEFMLTSRQKRNITLIVKEAWHNTAKYAQATVVTLDIKEVNRQLVISIIDNGVGFTTTISQNSMSGYGLDNMKEKAAAIGGQLTIESSPGQGTSIYLTWPLPTNDN
ncbi:sensor histidine kinase [Neolewinella persica]|uniref:sensor histidine kinase n=1 Tax=Neolewinella persica TaxID=70998 RepID=UPI0003644C10|nr:ATP-binding protein [Neolewinella persica]